MFMTHLVLSYYCFPVPTSPCAHSPVTFDIIVFTVCQNLK